MIHIYRHQNFNFISEARLAYLNGDKETPEVKPQAEAEAEVKVETMSKLERLRAAIKQKAKEMIASGFTGKPGYYPERPRSEEDIAASQKAIEKMHEQEALMQPDEIELMDKSQRILYRHYLNPSFLLYVHQTPTDTQAKVLTALDLAFDLRQYLSYKEEGDEIVITKRIPRDPEGKDRSLPNDFKIRIRNGYLLEAGGQPLATNTSAPWDKESETYNKIQGLYERFDGSFLHSPEFQRLYAKPLDRWYAGQMTPEEWQQIAGEATHRALDQIPITVQKEFAIANGVYIQHVLQLMDGRKLMNTESALGPELFANLKEFRFRAKVQGGTYEELFGPDKKTKYKLYITVNEKFPDLTFLHKTEDDSVLMAVDREGFLWKPEGDTWVPLEASKDIVKKDYIEKNPAVAQSYVDRLTTAFKDSDVNKVKEIMKAVKPKDLAEADIDAVATKEDAITKLAAWVLSEPGMSMGRILGLLKPAEDKEGVTAKAPEPIKPTMSIVKGEFVTEADGHFTINSNKPAIQDLFVIGDISEAVIKAGKQPRQGFKAGDEIKVRREQDTYKIVLPDGKLGEKLAIYKGDEIVSVTPQKRVEIVSTTVAVATETLAEADVAKVTELLAPLTPEQLELLGWQALPWITKKPENPEDVKQAEEYSKQVATDVGYVLDYLIQSEKVQPEKIKAEKKSKEEAQKETNKWRTDYIITHIRQAADIPELAEKVAKIKAMDKPAIQAETEKLRAEAITKRTPEPKKEEEPSSAGKQPAEEPKPVVAGEKTEETKKE